MMMMRMMRMIMVTMMVIITLSIIMLIIFFWWYLILWPGSIQGAPVSAEYQRPPHAPDYYLWATVVMMMMMINDNVHQWTMISKIMFNLSLGTPHLYYIIYGRHQMNNILLMLIFIFILYLASLVSMMSPMMSLTQNSRVIDNKLFTIFSKSRNTAKQKA